MAISIGSSQTTKPGIGAIRELPALLLLIVITAGMVITKPAFRTPENLTVVGMTAAVYGIMACGEAFVILTGGIDLSVGAVLALAACVTGFSLQKGVPWLVAVPLGLFTGAFAGWINGAFITHRKLPPILVTLASMMAFRAITSIETGASPYNSLPPAFTAMGHGYNPFYIFVVVVIIFAVLQARTRFGRRVVAVGGSDVACRLSAVPVDKVLRGTYVLAGLCAAIAGLLSAANANNAQWNLGDGFELDVIAAVVIGGVRMSGGEGSVVGAAIGALIIAVLQSTLALTNTPKEFYGLITGGVILGAAFAEQFRRMRTGAKD